MTASGFYIALKAAVSSGSERGVRQLLLSAKCDSKGYLHDFMCADLPQRPSECSRCQALLVLAPHQWDTHRPNEILRLLLAHGTYPSDEICAVGYRYNHARSTLL